jgi:hypothetical protein
MLGINYDLETDQIEVLERTIYKVTVTYQESETDTLHCGTILVEGNDVGNHLAGVCADTRKGEILSIEVEVAN